MSFPIFPAASTGELKRTELRSFTRSAGPRNPSRPVRFSARLRYDDDYTKRLSDDSTISYVEVAKLTKVNLKITANFCVGEVKCTNTKRKMRYKFFLIQ